MERMHNTKQKRVYVFFILQHFPIFQNLKIMNYRTFTEYQIKRLSFWKFWIFEFPPPKSIVSKVFWLCWCFCKRKF